MGPWILKKSHFELCVVVGSAIHIAWLVRELGWIIIILGRAVGP